MAQSIVPIEYAINYRINASYKEFIAQQYLRRNMDIVLSTRLREAVGSIDEIFGKHAQRVQETIDSGFSSVTDNLETITLSLDGIQESVDIMNANIVSGFQALLAGMEETNRYLSVMKSGVDSL